MGKNTYLNMRLSEEEQEMLEELARMTVRTKSDMVRFLIRQAWEKAMESAESTSAAANGNHQEDR